MYCLVVVVLQRDRHIAIAALLHIFGTPALSVLGIRDEADGEVGCLGGIDHLIVFGKLSFVDRLFVVGSYRYTEHVDRSIVMERGHIDLLFLGNWEQVVLVFQHHHTLDLGIISLLHEFGIAHELLRNSGIEIGVFEETNSEDVAQQSAG